MIFSIVIPAYNEEEAIASIVERCLAQRRPIVEQTPAEEVEVIVVSDGSVDRTVEIASKYKPDIRLIAYEKNRGYGAALKCGFENARGELVSFLDADGTCDPAYFIPMINNLVENDADIVIGSRMTPTSRMPRTRKIGNAVFRTIINILADANVTDCASGMRVIKRDSLAKIYPLPDGLHFTPAMTCRAVLDSGLKITEIPMHYEERIGRSKLGVVKDGLRFLGSILDIGLTYRPLRFLGILGVLFELIAFVLGLSILRAYFSTGMIQAHIIYRLIVLLTLAVSGLGLLTLGTTAESIVQYTSGKRREHRFLGLVFLFFYRPLPALLSGLLMFLLCAVLWLPSIFEYLSTGFVTQHWSFIVTGAFCFLMGSQLISHAILIHMVNRLTEIMQERSRLSGLLGKR